MTQQHNEQRSQLLRINQSLEDREAELRNAQNKIQDLMNALDEGKIEKENYERQVRRFFKSAFNCHYLTAAVFLKSALEAAYSTVTRQRRAKYPLRMTERSFNVMSKLMSHWMMRSQFFLDHMC